MEELTQQLFKVRPTSAEQNEFIITVGEHLATEKRFATKQDAERYIKYPKWDTTFALFSEMMDMHVRREKEQNNSADQNGSSQN